MNNYLKAFIKDNKEDIEEGNWGRIYLKLINNEYYEYLRRNNMFTPTDFTRCLAESGINPLSNMTYVPEFFLYKSNVRKIDLPKNIQSISSKAFYECNQLSDINLSNIRSIGDKVFYGCKNLNRIDLKYNVVLFDNAFTNAEIKELYVPERFSTRTHIDAFSGCKIENLYYDGNENLFEDMEMFFRGIKIQNIKYLK